MPKNRKTDIQIARENKIRSKVTTLTTVDEEHEYDQCDIAATQPQSELNPNKNRHIIHKIAQDVEHLATEVEDISNTAACELFILEEISKVAATGYEYASEQLADASIAAAKVGDKAKQGILTAWAMLADLTSVTFSNAADRIGEKEQEEKDVAVVAEVVAHAAHNIAAATGDNYSAAVTDDTEDFVTVDQPILEIARLSLKVD